MIELAEAEAAGLDAGKLQMLVYIAHGLALSEGSKLVYEPVVVWPQGAVFPELFEAVHSLGVEPIPMGWRILAFCPQTLCYKPLPTPHDGAMRTLITRVWHTFGHTARDKLGYFVFAAPGTPWSALVKQSSQAFDLATIIPEAQMIAQFQRHLQPSVKASSRLH